MHTDLSMLLNWIKKPSPSLDYSTSNSGAPSKHGSLCWAQETSTLHSPPTLSPSGHLPGSLLWKQRSCHSPGSLLLSSWAITALSSKPPSTYSLGTCWGSLSGTSVGCIFSNFACFSMKDSIPDMDRISDSWRSSKKQGSPRMQVAEQRVPNCHLKKSFVHRVH